MQLRNCGAVRPGFFLSLVLFADHGSTMIPSPTWIREIPIRIQVTYAGRSIARNLVYLYKPPRARDCNALPLEASDEQPTSEPPRCSNEHLGLSTDDSADVLQFLNWNDEALGVSSTQRSFGRNLLHIAVIDGDFEALEYILTHAQPPHLNARDVLGCTPATYAAFFADEVALEMLRESGADFSIADNEGRTVVYWLAHNAEGTSTLCQLSLTAIIEAPPRTSVVLETAAGPNFTIIVIELRQENHTQRFLVHHPTPPSS